MAQLGMPWWPPQGPAVCTFWEPTGSVTVDLAGVSSVYLRNANRKSEQPKSWLFLGDQISTACAPAPPRESVSARAVVLLSLRHAVSLQCSATVFILDLCMYLSLVAKLLRAALNMPCCCMPCCCMPCCCMPCCHTVAGHVQNSPVQLPVMLLLTSVTVAVESGAHTQQHCAVS